MEAILHIGTEKTATTSIQAFLYRNEAALRTAGILLTRSCGYPQNEQIPLLGSNTVRHGYCHRNGVSDGAALSRLREKAIAALAEELRRAGLPRVIFTSEDLQSGLRTRDEVRQLRTVLEGLGFRRFRVIVYLRHPVALMESRFSTSLRFGSTDTEPPAPEGETAQILCDHAATLERWSAAFGREAIVARLFRRDHFEGGTILKDFATAAGLPADGLDWTEIRENPGYPPLARELLLRLNRHLEPELRGNLHRFFDQTFNGGAGRYRMPPQLTAAYEDAFAPSLERLRQEWFPEVGELFPPTPAEAEVEAGLSEAALDQVADLLTRIWRQKQIALRRARSEAPSPLGYRLLRPWMRLFHRRPTK